MTALQAPLASADVAPMPTPAPPPTLTAVPTSEPDRPDQHPAPSAETAYDWPASPALELWALRVRLDALCRKGEARQGWVSCRLIRRAMG